VHPLLRWIQVVLVVLMVPEDPELQDHRLLPLLQMVLEVPRVRASLLVQSVLETR